MLTFRTLSMLIMLGIALYGCGGGGSDSASETPAPPSAPPGGDQGGSGDEPTDEPPTTQNTPIAAARLLNQASFGARPDDIDTVIDLGQEAWIDAQIDLTPSYHMPLVEPYADNEDFWRSYRISAWWHRALYAPDQLRQRVAFALSEIMVVSEFNGVLADDPEALTAYYDLLVEHAFGSYRELLEAVTLSPAMGVYLSMLGNEKPDEERNIRPDENYAREVMQLFSIGLVELNLDGTEKLDAEQQPIPSYHQTVIKGFAHVFTGWHFSGTTAQTWYRWWENFNLFDPMDAVDEYHDSNEKQLFSGVILPANQTAEQDLALALDALASHSNVAPFISKQLIQKLVTSNPSPAYVERIATVFLDNGSGEQGDLAAVVKAILLDEEAQAGHVNAPTTFGKVREPIIRAAHMWRAFNLTYAGERIDFGWPEYFFGQAPLASPSVFNFYRPDYSPITLESETGLLAPELQIATDSTMTNTVNFFAWYGLWRTYSGDPSDVDITEDDDMFIDITEEVTLVEQDGSEALLEHLNLVLTAGALNDEAIDLLVDAYEANEYAEPEKRIANLIFLIMSSPQYAIQR